jgi:hypothetical protein
MHFATFVQLQKTQQLAAHIVNRDKQTDSKYHRTVNTNLLNITAIYYQTGGISEANPQYEEGLNTYKQNHY